jgi:hypothetical protein
MKNRMNNEKTVIEATQPSAFCLSNQVDWLSKSRTMPANKQPGR